MVKRRKVGILHAETNFFSESVGAAHNEAPRIRACHGRGGLVGIGQHLLTVGLKNVLDESVEGPTAQLLYRAEQPIEVGLSVR